MKWKPVLAAFLISAMLAVPAYAEQGPQQLTGTENKSSAVVQIGSDDNFSGIPGSAQSEAPPLGIYPLNVTMQQVGNVPYITKVYEVPRDTDEEQLVQSFSQDGFNFLRSDILVEEIPGETETKFASKTLTFEAPSAKAEDLLPTIGHVYDYSEGGFAGQLAIDTNSISIAEEGRTSYRYTINDTRQFNGLDRNDASYIPKTVQKNGATLELQSVDWQVASSIPVDGGVIPSQYDAVAYYAGTATGSRVTGYIATVLYTGTVEQRMPATKRVSVVYRGEAPTAETPPADADDTFFSETSSDEMERGNMLTENPVTLILIAAGVLILAGFGAVWFLRKRRRKRWISSNAAKRRMSQ